MATKIGNGTIEGDIQRVAVESIKTTNPRLYDVIARLVMAGEPKSRIITAMRPSIQRQFAAAYPPALAKQKADLYLAQVEWVYDYLKATK